MPNVIEFTVAFGIVFSQSGYLNRLIIWGVGRFRQEIWDLKKKSFKRSSDLFFIFRMRNEGLATACKIIHTFVGFFDEMSVRFIRSGHIYFFFILNFYPVSGTSQKLNEYLLKKKKPNDLTKVTQLICSKGGSRIYGSLSPRLFTFSIHWIAPPDSKRECSIITLHRLGLHSEARFTYNPADFHQDPNQNQL